jgi:hypothetical protein
MSHHDTAPKIRTLQHDIQHGQEYARDHSGVLALTGLAIVAAIGGNALATESNKTLTCEAGDDTITALRGDTLWDISGSIAPEISPEVTMQQIAIVNPQMSEPGYILKEGDTISVPICGDDLTSR